MAETTQDRRPGEILETRLNADERDRTLRALDSLLEGDEAEHSETLAFLKEALERRR